MFLNGLAGSVLKHRAAENRRFSDQSGCIYVVPGRVDCRAAEVYGLGIAGLAGTVLDMYLLIHKWR